MEKLEKYRLDEFGSKIQNPETLTHEEGIEEYGDDEGGFDDVQYRNDIEDFYRLKKIK